MLLLELEIENLASLAGKHHINFKENLRFESLFAITGPTGSGKSTILAAISLALYGRHYKSELSEEELVTLGHGYARTSLKFHYQGQTYKSTYEITVNKQSGEKLKKSRIQRQLYKLEGENFIAINTPLKDLIRLNFDQFCKTIVLNQGEFHRFLLSDFATRKEILSKLMDEEKLIKMDQTLRTEIRKQESLVALKEAEIKGFQLLTHEEYENLDQEYVLLQNKEKILSLMQAQIATYHDEVKEIKSLLEQRKQNLKKEEEYSESLKQKRSEIIKQKILIEQVELEEKSLKEVMNTSGPKLFSAIELKKQVVINKQELNDLTQKIKKQEVLLKNNQEKEAATNRNLQELGQKNINLMKEIKIKIQAEEIQSLKENFKQYLEHLKQEELWDKETKIYQENLKSLEIKNTESLQTEQKKTQNLKELSAKKEALTHAHKEFPLAEVLKQKEQDYFLIEDVIKNATILEAQIKEDEKLLDKYMRETNLLTLEYLEKEKQKETLIQKLKFYELASAINHCQDASLSEGACVVCGQNFETLATSKIVEAAINADLSQEKEKLIKIEETLQALKIKQEKNALLAEQTTKSIQEARKKLLKTYKSVNALVFDELAVIKHKLIEDKKNLESIITSLAQIERDEQLLTIELSHLKTAHENYLLEKLKIQELTRTSETKSKEEEVLALHLLQKIIKICGQSNHLLTKDEIENFINRQESLVKINLELNHLNIQLSSISEEKEKIIQELKEKHIVFEQKTNLIKENEKFIQEISGDKDPEERYLELKQNITLINDKLTLKRESLKKLELMTKDLEIPRKMLLEQMDDIDKKVKNLLNKIKIKKEIAIVPDQIDAEINHYLELFSQLQGKIQVEGVTSELELSFFDLLYQGSKSLLDRLVDKIKNIQNKQIENRTTFNSYLKAKEQVSLILDEINSIKNKLSSLENFKHVFIKKDFRGFLLSSVEKQLLMLANHELKELCQERYELVQHYKKGPEFYVIDKYRDGQARHIHTLSGGETFLMSLALAFALAEMTRGQAEINCFFVDEGFGTLDEDSIEEVLQVLLNMQNRGKQIGIISHIAKLTDRIPLNLKVMKGSNGFSQLSFFQN